MDSAIVPRHACPTLVQPMQTGDGWLARLPPLIAPLTPQQLAGIAKAAAAHGNGIVEITGRGNFQIRGLAGTGGPALADNLAALGLDLPGGPPISADALLGPAEALRAREFADGLRRQLDASGLAARLAPKIALALDFGTPFAPAELSADIRIAFRSQRAFLAIGGDATSARHLGSVPATRAIEAVLALLERLVDSGAFARLAGSSAASEVSQIVSTLDGVVGFVPGDEAPLCRDAHAETRRPSAGEDFVAISFPFGQASAAPLRQLAEAAERAGVGAISPAPARRLLLAGRGARQLREMTSHLGFVTDEKDARQSIFACAGSGGCASGHLPTRDLAADLAIAGAELFDGSVTLHLSGCAKGCAHPQPTTLALVAIDNGLQVVLEGRPRDAAAGIVPAEGIAQRFAGLAAAVRSDGKSAVHAVNRLGGGGIVTLLGGEAEGEVGGRDGRGSGERNDRLSA